LPTAVNEELILKTIDNYVCMNQKNNHAQILINISKRKRSKQRELIDFILESFFLRKKLTRTEREK
jgi:hypothetical protein